MNAGGRHLLMQFDKLKTGGGLGHMLGLEECESSIPIAPVLVTFYFSCTLNRNRHDGPLEFTLSLIVSKLACS